MDLRSEVAVVPATQATHLSNSSKVTSTSTNISVRASSSSSTVRTTSREEINISVKATRHPAFLPQQPTRTAKQRQRKEDSCMFPLWGTKPLGESLPK
jgi:ribosomal protein L31